MNKSNIELNAKGIIWDFDGTILDSYKLHEVTMLEMINKHGLPVPSSKTLSDNYHGSLKDSIQGITGASGELLTEIYEDFMQSEEHHYEDPATLYFEDAVELMRRSHELGIKQIIVSNRAHFSDTRLGSPRNLAQRPPIRGYIDAVVCGDDNEFYKPDARMLDKAEAMLNLNSKDFIVIGDQYIDAELAHNLGVQAVLVMRKNESIPHLDRLKDESMSNIKVVSDLSQVSVLPLQ